MSARSDYVGQTFGRLTVVSFHEVRKNKAYWLCRCKCGNEKIAAGTNLRPTAKKPIRSCGCLRKEKTARMGRATRRHGEAIARTPEYTAWRNIIIRCYNPNASNWQYYGAQGVKVCDRWRNSFDAFLADMGRRPPDKTSIDRYPDKYGDYSPENCRWATHTEQMNNRRPHKRKK